MAEKKSATKAKPAKVSTEVAEQTVLDYLTAQNRPYNNKMVHENLHNSIAATQVTKALEDLASSNRIVRKENKKQKIYWALQDDSSGGSGEQQAEEKKRLDASIAAAKAELESAKARLAEAQEENKRLSAEPTLQQCRERTARAKAESEELSRALEKIKEAKEKAGGGGGEEITAERMKKAEETCERRRAVWLKRKRLCREVLDKVTESGGKSVAEFVEELGLETDESANVDYADQQREHLRKRQKTS